ncbi:hypothetical protein Tco_0296911, partial [Tanacetum coccineum]
MRDHELNRFSIHASSRENDPGVCSERIKDLDFTPKDVRFDAESYLLESLVNHDTLMASPPKIDFFLDEFAGELTRLQSIPPGIDNINLDPKGDILFLESLLYDNSSPRPPEEFNSENPTESFSPSPIPV